MNFLLFFQEPPKDLSLVNHPKVVSTPHLGANTTEAQLRVAKEIAEQFVDVVNGKSLFGAVSLACFLSFVNPFFKAYTVNSQKFRPPLEFGPL